MSTYDPPPTYAEVVLVDPVTKRAAFNPIWLRWFLGLVRSLGAGGAGSVSSIAISLSAGITGSVSSPTSDVTITLTLGAITPTSVTASAAIQGATIKATSVAGYISSDGSTGFTGTVTTGSLVGKTITIKDGIITNFA